MTETTETGPAREDSTERCTNDSCGHTKRDHSGRRDHTTKHPDIPLRPWCHACKTECLYEPAATVTASATADGSVREQLLDALDFAYCQGLGYGTPEELLAAYDVTLLPAPTDQTALRDRIRRAVCEAEGFAWDSDMLEPDEYGEVADMVLAVLPEPTERAAALREAAERYERLLDDMGEDKAKDPRYWQGVQHVTVGLRGLADAASGPGGVAGEPQQDETQARRGDAVEAWLKAQRDEYHQTTGPQWVALDEVLDTYRLHADTGTPLGEHVCEGQAVGDCDCLEQPAAVSQPDGEA
jgi:hypothetical protein